MFSLEIKDRDTIGITNWDCFYSLQMICVLHSIRVEEGPSRNEKQPNIRLELHVHSIILNSHYRSQYRIDERPIYNLRST